jgi:phenylalanyl-tRNA synthetase beta chain
VQESPLWLQQKLKAIGQRPINNIVDVTNFILHETGQPLHAFDLDAIKGREVVIKNLPQGTPFKTLDGKERSLHEQDLMICNGTGEPMCIAGVFGGQDSGVTTATTRIFLESAWFNPIDIRKTSFRHGLRTDAALRFEKNRDISSTADVLTRAAALITTITGGSLASDIIDVYPDPQPRKKLSLSYAFLHRLSGKYYEPEKVNRILQGLGFNILSSNQESVAVEIPPHKPDISLQADLVEEIMRIDGLDNITIPATITLSPSIEKYGYKQVWKEKIAGTLAGIGFNEISTNSITNSAYFDEEALSGSVKLLNNLSAEHNLLRPSMLETGLEVMAHNINRKNNDLRLFEFGKTYHRSTNSFEEIEHLCLYVTGLNNSTGWRAKPLPADLYYIKGVLESLFQVAGINGLEWAYASLPKLQDSGTINLNGQPLASFGKVSREELKRFDIKQSIFFADIHWNQLLPLINERLLKYQEIPRQLPVFRDLAMVIPSDMAYENVEKTVKKLKLNRLKDIKLFDIFESDKLGKGKKSVAVNFMFLDPETTLTDTEIEGMMNKLMQALEKELKAEIRKQ